MKRHLKCFAVLTILTIFPITACTKPEPSNEVAGSDVRPQVATDAEVLDPVKRGEYLVTIGGCHDCHTPFKMTDVGPVPDMDLMLSGHPEKLVMPSPPVLEGPWVWAGSGTNTAFAGPWGVSYSINLTPDTNTGMGIWTEELFIAAMKSGKHFGTSRPIMPPMPWQNLSRATDQDLKAIYAYLRSIKPISNRVPEYQPPQSSPAVLPAS